ncbi:MAG TPA: capsule assembly Wzi family protein [Lacibacter sp.]|nr:capsule assembly Wzi family protein [Lacibacter sp.]
MQGSRYLHVTDRLEIKTGTVSDLNFTGTRPYDRRYVVEYLGGKVDSMRSVTPLFYSRDTALRLSTTDTYNLNSLYLNNQEWVQGDRSVFASKKPLLRNFYTTPAHLLAHYVEDFFIAVDPLLQYRQSAELNNTGQNIFLNQRGLAVRGAIGGKVGFAASAMDVQERGPLFFQDWVDSLQAVPGGNFYKVFKKTGVDYIDARGSFTFRAAKYINFHAGYDRNFIGNGYRSLLLSDFAGNNLFVKINTRLWKFNYQNLFMELHAGAANNNTNNLVPRKYLTMHHLGMNLTPWLNVGLFEAVVFGRKDRFEFGYMNPIIFFRSIEGNLGSRDNALVGTDFKANFLQSFQVYGQLLLDELNISKLRQDRSWWGNKTGLQLGMKYIDVANISNLDAQVEWNRVRPFTYGHFDSVSNYSHYNQPLAHPLGANFNEWLVVLRYQPTGRLNLSARLIYWKQGQDSSSTGRNSGSNIFRLSGDGRNSEFGYNLLNGQLATGVNAAALASYEIKNNIFIDGHVLLRRFLKGAAPAQTTTLISLGVRMNLWYRDYDY